MLPYLEGEAGCVGGGWQHVRKQGWCDVKEHISDTKLHISFKPSIFHLKCLCGLFDVLPLFLLFSFFFGA